MPALGRVVPLLVPACARPPVAVLALRHAAPAPSDTPPSPTSARRSSSPATSCSSLSMSAFSSPRLAPVRRPVAGPVAFSTGSRPARRSCQACASPSPGAERFARRFQLRPEIGELAPALQPWRTAPARQAAPFRRHSSCRAAGELAFRTASSAVPASMPRCAIFSSSRAASSVFGKPSLLRFLLELAREFAQLLVQATATAAALRLNLEPRVEVEHRQPQRDSGGSSQACQPHERGKSARASKLSSISLAWRRPGAPRLSFHCAAGAPTPWWRARPDGASCRAPPAPAPYPRRASAA